MITNAQITGLIPTSNLPMYEKRTNNPIGYSSNAFPNSDITVLEIFFYDDYDFDGNGLPDFTYLDPPDKLKNQVEQISSDSQIKSNVAAGITISYWNLPTAFNRGKLTGSKTRILGSNDWITSASFYSEYGRVLQTQTSNHLSGVDVADMTYGFDGLLIKSNLKHAAFGTTIEVFNQFDYDHAGRLIAGWEQHNNGTIIQLSEKRYNELGQLIENNLGVNNGNNLQSVDFAYNIRGWLTHINNADLSNDNVVAVDSNAYSEEINEIEINQITIETETSKDEFGNDQLTIIVEDERTNTYLEESTNTEKEVTTSTESESNLRETESNESTLDELSALNKKLEIDLNNMTFNEGTSLSQAYDQIEILVIQELTLNGIVDPAAVEEVVQNVINHLQKSIGNVYFNNDNDDLFGMELNYNRTQSNGLLPNAQYNGNISQLLWQSKGDEVKRAYDFTYDASNRLTSAGYREYDKVAETWSLNIDRYSVPTISYDANGNILSLERKGYLSNNTFGTIDQLTYSYDQNRLKAVEDVVTTGGYADFKNNVTNTTEYSYDANGNLISDLNKGISVQYNVLNLPELITFQNGSTIAYTYTANGQKLTATFMNAQDNSSYSRQYVGSFVYNDTQLEFFGTAEGRAISDPSTGGFLVEYHYKDHLGNTRLTFSDRDNSGVIDIVTEVLQQEHYYPYGMTFEGTNAAVIDGKHQFLYTGKENYDQFGLNWMDFGARFYDPALGRWHSVDPLASAYSSWSPYNMVLGNPLRLIDPTGMGPEDWVSPGFGEEWVTDDRVVDQATAIQYHGKNAIWGGSGTEHSVEGGRRVKFGDNYTYSYNEFDAVEVVSERILPSPNVAEQVLSDIISVEIGLLDSYLGLITEPTLDYLEFVDNNFIPSAWHDGNFGAITFGLDLNLTVVGGGGFEVGVVSDFTSPDGVLNGPRVYATPYKSEGIDGSIGPSISYLKAETSDFKITDMRGFGQSQNLGAIIFDLGRGGNSAVKTWNYDSYSNLNSSKYTDYSIGVSYGSPGGYTQRNSYTYLSSPFSSIFK